MRTAGAASVSPPEVLCASLEDLGADFGELGWIAGATRSRAEIALAELQDAEPFLERGVFRVQCDELLCVIRKASMLKDSALTLREIASSARPKETALEHLATEKRAHAERIRALQSFAAAAITGSDWQSPSFAHSVAPQAGRFAGRITEHVDDYRRDRHADASAFEEAYLREYVDHQPGQDLRALMTNCGMSAFTTVLAHLLMQERPSRVVVGRGLYHECKQLVLRSPLGEGAVEADEDDVGHLLAVVDAVRPEVIFLDALCNEKGLALPDLPALLAHLSRRRSEPLTVVLDITGLSWTIQPFRLLPPGDCLVRLVVVESLTKYLQFGLDRTPAGMIVAPVGLAADLDRYREHLGTNVSDVAPYLIPPPRRDALKRRLNRIGRNAQKLAEEVPQGEVVGGASYPGLPAHPAWPRARELSFRGGYFSVNFSPETDCPQTHRRFLEAVLHEARTRGVPIAAGASFGFDVTRIYRTSDDADHAQPFVRIAAGTEHLLAVERLSVVLEAAERRLDPIGLSLGRPLRVAGA